MRPLCSHIRPHAVASSHRAKPVSEMERSGIELHCGPAPCSGPIPSNVPAPCHRLRPHTPPPPTQQSRSSRKVKPMIDFEEELKKFQPSKEVDDTEETIRKRNITDMTDIMRQLLKEVRENQ